MDHVMSEAEILPKQGYRLSQTWGAKSTSKATKSERILFSCRDFLALQSLASFPAPCAHPCLHLYLHPCPSSCPRPCSRAPAPIRPRSPLLRPRSPLLRPRFPNSRHSHAHRVLIPAVRTTPSFDPLRNSPSRAASARSNAVDGTRSEVRAPTAPVGRRSRPRGAAYPFSFFTGLLLPVSVIV